MKKIWMLAGLALGIHSNIWADFADDLIQLKSMGLDDDTLVTSVHQSESKLEPKDMIKLVQSGFSSELVKRMLMKPVTTAPVAAVAPQTVVIQQQVAPAGQVEITIHTHAKGGKLHVDGELVSTLHHGINKINVPTGEHELRMDHADEEYTSVVNIDAGKPNVFYIFFLDEPNENSRAEFERYKKANKRQISMLVGNPFKTDLVDSDGFNVGKTFYTKVMCEPYATVKIFGTEKTRLRFTGLFNKTIFGTKYSKEKNYSNDTKTIFFSMDIDKNLNTLDSVVYDERVHDQYESILSQIKRLDDNLALIKTYNSEEHPANVKVVMSEKARKDSEGFSLKIHLSETLYNFDLGAGQLAVCPLESSYTYTWARDGIDPSESFKVPEDENIVIAVHSNWLGNKTQVHKVPKDTDLSQINFDNVKSHSQP
jgi:hypothetical protein